MPSQRISISHPHIGIGDFQRNANNSAEEIDRRHFSNERRGKKPRNLFAVKSCSRRHGERRRGF